MTTIDRADDAACELPRSLPISTLDEDTGEYTCGACTARYLPLPGFMGDGHRCDGDGTQKTYMSLL